MPDKDEQSAEIASKKIEKRKSRLETLRVSKKTIESPFKRLEKLQLQSWFHNGLCDALWAVLIRSSFKQAESIAIFRQILATINRDKDLYDGLLLTHSTQASLSEQAFDFLFGSLIQDENIRNSIAPLCLIECLPDKLHWKRHLRIEDEGQSWNQLAYAVATCVNHQSQEATDVRWLKPMSKLAQGKMHIPEKLREVYENIVEYPNLGDMRSVRPSIRASEGALRSFEEMEGRGGLPWSESFWNECWQQTECFLVNPDQDAKHIDHEDLMRQISTVGIALQSHFISTIVTTNVDARHDSAFGLAFYLLQLLIFSTALRMGQTVPARIILRTALECYITLAYLAKKDDPTVWLQYRNYGAGQARLSFLKMLDQTEMPSFMNPETMESLASEDFWHEYLDIKLGSWSNKNLREMAMEAGIKSTYDKYYDSLSGYVHANWASVLHTSFGLCGNPLHRFHRIPHPPRRLRDDAMPDLVKIVNIALDLITSLYPPFKPRVRL